MRLPKWAYEDDGLFLKDWVIGLFLAGGFLLLGLGVWGLVKSNSEEWEKFKVEHHCVKTDVDLVNGVTGWKCDNGVTYWR